VERRICHNTVLELSVLGAGCWAFGGGAYWGDQNQKDVDAVVRRSVELGINYFDTAEAYNGGRSEESLGLALQGLPREQWVIGTKVSPSNCYPTVLAEHCEASLRRLRTDYIDLYMIHWPIHAHSIRHFTQDAEVIAHPPRVDEAFATLQKLRSQGKIRHIGVSNFARPRMEEAIRLCPELAASELPYSLLTRAIELETMPFCQRRGVGVIGYMTLLQGLLADIYQTLDDVPPYQRRTRHFDCRRCEFTRHGEHGAEVQTNAALAGIREVAVGLGRSMPEVAIQWALAGDGITCALVGARNIQELEANVHAAGQTLPADALTQLNEATQPLLDRLGPGFDYYESAALDRTG